MGHRFINEKYKALLSQFIKFGIVGILNTCVDLFVFFIFNSALGMVYVYAKVISYSCGVINSYMLNKYWTFKNQAKGGFGNFHLFILVNIVSLGVAVGLMALCKNIFNINNDLYCNIISIPASVIVNFLGNKFFVFNNKQS